MLFDSQFCSLFYLAILSVKSIPSETFPLQTARRIAPPALEVAALE